MKVCVSAKLDKKKFFNAGSEDFYRIIEAFFSRFIPTFDNLVKEHRLRFKWDIIW